MRGGPSPNTYFSVQSFFFFAVNTLANGVRISIANNKQDQINNAPRRADFPLRLCAFARDLFLGRSRRLTDLRLGLLINCGSELFKDGIY